MTRSLVLERNITYLAPYPTSPRQESRSKLFVLSRSGYTPLTAATRVKLAGTHFSIRPRCSAKLLNYRCSLIGATYTNERNEANAPRTRWSREREPKQNWSFRPIRVQRETRGPKERWETLPHFDRGKTHWLMQLYHEVDENCRLSIISELRHHEIKKSRSPGQRI